MALLQPWKFQNGDFPRWLFLAQIARGRGFRYGRIRYKADCDYRLSPTAKGVRWLVVAIGYALAALCRDPVSCA